MLVNQLGELIITKIKTEKHLDKIGFEDKLRRDFYVGCGIIGKNNLLEYAETGYKTIEISKEIW